MRKLAVPIAAAALAIAAPQPSSRAANGECSDNDGITVVVDFQSLGSGVHVRCAPQPVDSGFAALRQADIGYDTTPQGFICRIAGMPAEPKGGCRVTPPASEFWAYWIAARGGQWCYANVGPGYRKPPPGSVEGWAFSKDKSAGEIPKPNYPVPGPIPGQQPNEVAPGDCEQQAPSPAPTPATRPAQPPATPPQSPSPTSGTTGTTPAARPVAVPGAVIGSHPTAADAPAAPPGAAEQVGPLADPGSIIAGVPGAEPASVQRTAALPEQAASIDLNPPGPTSSPRGLAVTLLMIDVLVGLAIWLGRRRPQ